MTRYFKNLEGPWPQCDDIVAQCFIAFSAIIRGFRPLIDFLAYILLHVLEILLYNDAGGDSLQVHLLKFFLIAELVCLFFRCVTHSSDS